MKRENEKTEAITLRWRIDSLRERTGVILLALLFLGCNICYVMLPDAIPVHFNAQGYADSYNSKAYFFVIPAIGILLYMGLTVLNSDGFISRKTRSIYREVSENPNARAAMLTKLVVLVACAIEIGETARRAFKGMGQRGWVATVSELLLLLIPLTYYLVNLSKIRQAKK